jgi:hypothetical protein
MICIMKVTHIFLKVTENCQNNEYHLDDKISTPQYAEMPMGVTKNVLYRSNVLYKSPEMAASVTSKKASQGPGFESIHSTMCLGVIIITVLRTSA